MWKMDGLGDSVGCGLLKDMGWGNTINMTVVAWADDETLIGSLHSQLVESDNGMFIAAQVLLKQGCWGTVTTEASITRAESWWCFHPNVEWWLCYIGDVIR